MSHSLRALVEQLFQPGDTPRAAGAMGAELELIPGYASTGRRALLAPDGYGSGTVGMIRAAARRAGWQESPVAYGAPSWTLDATGGVSGRLSYEPGGQLEISSPVCDTPAELVDWLRYVVGALRDAGDADGIDLLACGVDPFNRIQNVPLVLHAPRYDRMTAYFDRIGPAGVQMMRQTASLQLNVELGPDPLERWRLLNALAPYLTAAFANSRSYAGKDTGCASYRAHLWQVLDPSRTGLAYDATDPIGAYTRFAERAGRILDDDAAHLTTLFPEVRPRCYFEIRSLDAMELDDAERAIALVHALLETPDATAAALAIVGEPDASLLPVAARDGCENALLASRVQALRSLASPRAPHADDASARRAQAR